MFFFQHCIAEKQHVRSRVRSHVVFGKIILHSADLDAREKWFTDKLQAVFFLRHRTCLSWNRWCKLRVVVFCPVHLSKSWWNGLFVRDSLFWRRFAAHLLAQHTLVCLFLMRYMISWRFAIAWASKGFPDFVRPKIDHRYSVGNLRFTCFLRCIQPGCAETSSLRSGRLRTSFSGACKAWQISSCSVFSWFLIRKDCSWLIVWRGLARCMAHAGHSSLSKGTCMWDIMLECMDMIMLTHKCTIFWHIKYKGTSNIPCIHAWCRVL